MTHVVTLREVVETSTGTRNPRATPNVLFTYVDVAAVNNQTKNIYGAKAVMGAEAPSRARKLLRSGDVLVSTVRPNLNAVALVPPELDGQIGSTGFCVLRAERATVLPEYLFFFVRSTRFIEALTSLVSGAMYPAVTDSQVLDQRIPLIPLSEQRRTVDLLSRAEGIVRLRREAQKRAAAIIPAFFIDMFGDPATNPRGWSLESFGTLGSLDRGKSRHRPRDAAELYGGPYPFIQTGDVANSGGRITRYSNTYSEAGLQQSKLWPKGTLCITIAANIANTGILEFDGCFPDSVVGFLPGDKITTAYIQGWLHFLQPMLEARAPQAAQKNINLEILRALSVPVPPIDLQRRYEQHCLAVSSIIKEQSEGENKANAMFRSLLARLFGQDKQHATRRGSLPLEGVPCEEEHGAMTG